VNAAQHTQILKKKSFQKVFLKPRGMQNLANTYSQKERRRIRMNRKQELFKWMAVLMM
jgi:hypothetical protein